MKHFLLNKILASVVLGCTLLTSGSLLAGGGDFGGSSLVLLKNCQVELVDFYNPDLLAGEVETDSNNVLNCYWGDRTILPKNQVVQPEPRFFDRAFAQLKNHFTEFPIFQTMYLYHKLTSRGKQPAYQAQTTQLPPLASLDEKFFSKSVDNQIQVPFIDFNGTATIFIRFLDRSPNSEKERILNGAAIHEMLRFANFSQFLEEELSTEEIEVVVRYFSNLSRPTDDTIIGALLNKVKNTNEGYRQSRELVEATFGLLLASDSESNIKNYPELSEKEIRNLRTKGEQLKEPLNQIKKLQESSSPESNKVFEKIQERIKKQAQEHTNILKSCHPILAGKKVDPVEMGTCGMAVQIGIVAVGYYPMSLSFLGNALNSYTALASGLMKSEEACFDVRNFKPVPQCSAQ